MKLPSRCTLFILLTATGCSSERPDFGSRNEPDGSLSDTSRDASNGVVTSDAQVGSNPDAHVVDAGKTGSEESNAEDANVEDAGHSSSILDLETTVSVSTILDGGNLITRDASADASIVDGSVDTALDASRSDADTTLIVDTSTAEALTSTSGNPTESTNATTEVDASTADAATSTSGNPTESTNATTEVGTSSNTSSVGETSGPLLDYAEVVQPIFEAKCSGCHETGGAAMNEWYGPDGAEPTDADIKAAIKSRVEGNSMPPAGNPALTDSEKDIIVEWADQ